MINYDFLILSPTEFENISRDILQKKYNVFIESFTTGRDGGIDFRFAKFRLKPVIIQSKRYNNFPSLFKNLRKEAEKVKRLSPSRYIVTTSVGLTPENKRKIKSLFGGIIRNEEDILGRDDLNNLIGAYRDIEIKYYKLWISSTTILDKVLHGKIYNQSAFELEEIKENVKLYVQNNSFNQALDILIKNSYLIISGIPGIGKTTLARVLTLYLLGEGFEEFVYINDNIDDAYTFFKDGRKQVFLFDDFLGRNFFDSRKRNEDSKIVKFIEKIKRSHDKLFILTTREYILNQAQTEYEAFKINNIEVAKCILDLSSYTNFIRAQILYNHLYFAGIPEDCISNLVDKKNYLQLVKHPNYNPRIIEAVINQKLWLGCNAQEFGRLFKNLFDNPESVWAHSFEKTLDEISQYGLLVLLTLGTPVLVEDWIKALNEFLFLLKGKNSLNLLNSVQSRSMIRNLENAFIKTQKDSYDGIVVDYQNPSIQDYLRNYLQGDNNLIRYLLNSAIYLNQFFTIFSASKVSEYAYRSIIFINNDLADSIFKRLITIYTTLSSSKIYITHVAGTEKYYWRRENIGLYSFLNTLFDELIETSLEVKDFIYAQLQINTYISTDSFSEHEAYIELLSKVDLNQIQFDKDEIINSLINNASSLYQYELLARIKNIFPDSFLCAVGNPLFFIKLNNVLEDEISNVLDSDLSDLRARVEGIEIIYNCEFRDKIEELIRREEDYSNLLDSQIASYIDQQSAQLEGQSELEEEKEIDELFKSLALECG